MHNKKLVGYYNYTVILTYLGMMSAFMGIICCINEKYALSIACLITSGICDMFDGAIASTRDRNQYEKHFGIQIDSLCDLISFGVLPGIFVYMISGKNPGTGLVACFYILAALIRLAFYNVQEYERQRTDSGHRDIYTGLPVTTVSAFLPLLFLVYHYSKSNCIIWFSILLIILGIGFVSGFSIRKPKILTQIISAVISVGKL